MEVFPAHSFYDQPSAKRMIMSHSFPLGNTDMVNWQQSGANRLVRAGNIFLSFERSISEFMSGWMRNNPSLLQAS